MLYIYNIYHCIILYHTFISFQVLKSRASLAFVCVCVREWVQNPLQSCPIKSQTRPTESIWPDWSPLTRPARLFLNPGRTGLTGRKVNP